MPKKKWKIAEKTTDDLFKQLLINRGLTTDEEQENFLNPPKPTLDYILFHSKIDQSQLDKAIDRIIKAIKEKELIIVFGDYDADGITGTTILWETIYLLGGNCLPYIPDRETEGYGLSKKGIEKIAAQGAKLIITVDCGITNIEEIKLASKLDIDVIITDHHKKEKKDPTAFAIVHDDTLVGASVAWVLAAGLKEKCDSNIGTQNNEKLQRTNWDVAAIGTIADLQPLIGKNRSFVKWGLEELNNTSRMGLQSLIRETDLESKTLDTYHVGFVLAPRLNATGRLEDAMDGLRLLCTNDKLQAFQLSSSIGKLNSQRQEMTLSSFEQAIELIQDEKKKIIVLSHSEWHEGIVGLIASRIKEKYYRPTIAISVQENIGKGSARSIDGFNIIEALREVQHLLLDCGGHPMAAGFAVDREKIDLFVEAIESLAEKRIEEEILDKKIFIDSEIQFSDLDWDLYNIVSQFRPFGAGNREPLFILKNILVDNPKLIGKQKNHLKFKVEKSMASPKSFDVLAFGEGNRYGEIRNGQSIDLVFSLQENVWNGNRSLVLKAKDFKLS